MSACTGDDTAKFCSIGQGLSDAVAGTDPTDAPAMARLHRRFDDAVRDAPTELRASLREFEHVVQTASAALSSGKDPAAAIDPDDGAAAVTTLNNWRLQHCPH